jgi:hypothetical protein
MATVSTLISGFKTTMTDFCNPDYFNSPLVLTRSVGVICLAQYLQSNLDRKRNI